MNRNPHGGVFTRGRCLVELSTAGDRLYYGQSVLAVPDTCTRQHLMNRGAVRQSRETVMGACEC